MLLWRNWLARSAVNRKAGGSSPPRSVIFFEFFSIVLSQQTMDGCPFFSPQWDHLKSGFSRAKHFLCFFSSAGKLRCVSE